MNQPTNNSFVEEISSSHAPLRRGVFLSDLHLFSSRCNVSFDLSAVHAFRTDSDCIVLGGDLFDFKWSRYGDAESTSREALLWLKAFLSETGDSHVIYLSGNHDCLPGFEEALSEYAKNCPRFHWIEHACKVGDCLFLHGDILDANGASLNALRDYRREFHHPVARPVAMHRMYDIGVELRLHIAVASLIRKKIATCLQLANVLQSQTSFDFDSVQRVYFGHTHVPIDGIKYDGKQFFNPGAMLKYAKFQPVEFPV